MYKTLQNCHFTSIWSHKMRGNKENNSIIPRSWIQPVGRTGRAHRIHVSCGKNESTLLVQRLWCLDHQLSGKRRTQLPFFCLMQSASQLPAGEEEGSLCWLNVACAKHVMKAGFADPPNSMVGSVLSLVYSWGTKAQQGHPAEDPQVINEVLTPVSARPSHSLISYQEIITFGIQMLKTVLSTTLGYKWSLAVLHQ